MNVTLPDGTVIQDVPENITKAELTAKLARNGYDVSRLEAKPEQKQNLMDAPNAVATGYNKGLLSLAGLPVDTIANIRDLGKAAIGAPYTATTGKPPPDWLQVGNREDDVGSGANLIRAGQKYAAPLFKAQNPEYEGGYLQSGGAGLGAVMNPSSGAQIANQAMLGGASALAGKFASEKSDNPAWSILASLLPGAGQQAANNLTKYAIRGGEKGRQDMAQRVADLEAAGVTSPTVGLATGNKFIGGVENMLGNTPGSVGKIRDARQTILDQLQNKVAGAADMASIDRGALRAGQGIQEGLNAFKGNAEKGTGFKGTQKELYNKLDSFIKSQDEVGVSNTMAALEKLNADIPTMPELSKQFKNSRILSIEGALKKDLAPVEGKSPGTTQVVETSFDGIPTIKTVPLPPTVEREARTGVPYEAAKKLRTLVGGEIENSNFLSDIPRDKWKSLYGSLSGDIETLAKSKGPQAEQASKRANDYTRSGIERMERTASFADKTAPEDAFKSLSNTLNENVSTFQAVKKSLPEGARGQVAGTVIERLGKATNSNQNAGGDVWSPETFLTNWNKITPKGKQELLSGFPNSAQVAADIDAVAKTASMMRDNSKLWSNPSGTAANLAARGTIGAIGLGGAAAIAGLGSGLIPLAAGGSVLGARLTANALTDKRSLAALLRNEDATTSTESMLRALISGGYLGKDQQKDKR